MKKFICFLLFVIQTAYSQIPTDPGTVPPIDWTKAGYKGKSADIPHHFDRIVNVMRDFNVKGDNVTDDAPTIQAAINAYSDFTVYYFPPGNYRLGSTIVLRSKCVILGAGSTQTIFRATHSSNVFLIQGTEDAFQSNFDPSSLKKDATTVTLPISPATGSFVEIEGFNTSLIMPGNPWDGSIGQIVRINTGDGSANVILDEKLRLDFYTLRTPQVAQLHPISDVGFEKFKIDNEGVDANQSNIIFTYAADCWVCGVESYNPSSSHIGISRSACIEIRDSYFHEAKNYGQGGHGYGVMIVGNASSCLIENNVFRHLRHAMILNSAANGNVFSFNYSTDQYSPGDATNGDVCFHGYFNFANLFEGNYVDCMVADLVWGINGPYNTFFRNFVNRSTNIIRDLGYGGINIAHANGYAQNFRVLGNIVSCSLGILDVHYSSNDIWNSDESGNCGNCWTCPGSCSYQSMYSGQHEAYTQYKKDGCPSFIPTPTPYTWPPMGCKYRGNAPTESIPARDRGYIALDTISIDNLLPVILANDLGGTQSVGKLGLLEKTGSTQNWSSGSSQGKFLVSPNSSQTARTEATHLSYSNSDWRHHHWNTVFSDNNQQYLFPVLTSPITQTAFFKSAQPLTVQASFVDIGTYGKVLYQGNLYDSPYSDYGFMPPYSTSIGVPQTQPNIPSGNWIFAGWQDGISDLTRSISLNSPMTYIATYKAHLGSSISTASSPNSQRRIICDGQGKYHLFYQSAGEIWYAWAYSADIDPSLWSPEVRISEGNSSIMNSNPAATLQNYSTGYPWPGLDTLRVVWESKNGSTTSIKFRTIDPTTGAMGAIENAVPVATTSNAPATPMIATVDPTQSTTCLNHCFIVWYDGTSNSVKCATRYVCIGWTAPAILLSGVSQFSLLPITDIASWTTTGPYHHLSYIKNYSVYYCLADPVNLAVNATQLASSGSSWLGYTHPCIGYENGRPSISWKSISPAWPVTIINYVRQMTNSTWSTLTSWQSAFNSNYDYPTSTTYYWGTGAYLLWQRDNSVILSQKQPNNSWSTISTLTSTGKYPLLSTDLMQYTELIMVSSGTSTPYAIQTIPPWYAGMNLNVVASGESAASPSTKALSKTAGDKTASGKHPILLQLPSAQEGRGGMMIFDDAIRRFAVMRASAAGEPLSFVPMNDTIPVTSQKNVEPLLVSNTFNGTGTLKLKTQYMGHGEISFAAGYRLILRDANTNGREKVIQTFTGEQDTIIEYTMNLNNPGKQFCLAIQPIGIAKASWFNVERWIDGESEQTTNALVKSITITSEQANLIPSEYGLDQNFPNPFNPATVINYRIPENGNVKLTVYDMLGRQVAALVDGMKESGYYTVTFDGSHLASGVYFARLTATPENGNKPFSQTMKMQLIK